MIEHGTGTQSDTTSLDVISGGDHPKHAAHVAQVMMDAADRLNKDGLLSLLEIETFLVGTRYQSFAVWLKARLTGARSNIRLFDRDGDGCLNIEELEDAISAYLVERELAGDNNDDGPLECDNTRGVTDHHAPAAGSSSLNGGSSQRRDAHGTWLPQPVSAPALSEFPHMNIMRLNHETTHSMIRYAQSPTTVLY